MPLQAHNVLRTHIEARPVWKSLRKIPISAGETRTSNDKIGAPKDTHPASKSSYNFKYVFN
jgi:hypothetical protein